MLTIKKGKSMLEIEIVDAVKAIQLLEDEACFVHAEANLLRAAMLYAYYGGEEFWLTRLASRCANNALHKIELEYFGRLEDCKGIMAAAKLLAQYLDF